ncbi:MAG: ion transporter [Phycisphaerae bacterium]
MNAHLQKRTFEILEAADDGDRLSYSVDLALASLIVLNVLAAIVQTVDPVYKAYGVWFDGFELISVIIFSLEYLLRVWSCTVSSAFAETVKGRIRFMLTPMAIIDLLAIVPFFLTAMSFDFRMLRAIRMVRLLRILKIARYSETLQLLARVMINRKNELLVTMLAVTVLLIFASTLMYYAERDVQPEQFSSIPASMWWGVATLTTVGYGDIYPVSPLGKALGAGIAVLGIGLFALPAGILGSGFVEAMEKKHRQKEVCPHCGEHLE